MLKSTRQNTNKAVQMFDPKQKLGYLVKLHMMQEAESPERHLEQRVEESHTEHEQQGVGKFVRKAEADMFEDSSLNFLEMGPTSGCKDLP